MTLRDTLRRRFVRRLTIAGTTVPVPPGSGVSVYEIDGRLILRVIDGSGGLGIERSESLLVDGFPDVDAVTLGDHVVSLAADVRSVELPASSSKLSEYARPLLDVSPGRYRSYRSWQRAARRVTVTVRPDAIRLVRMHADLGRGSWRPIDPDHPRAAGHPQQTVLDLSATAAAIGAAVLDLLAQPPIAG